MGYIESIFLGAFYDGRENCQGRWLMLNATILDLTLNAYISEEHVQWAVERLNHRPRKVLGYRTPHEVFFGVEVNYTEQPLAVALRT